MGSQYFGNKQSNKTSSNSTDGKLSKKKERKTTKVSVMKAGRGK